MSSTDSENDALALGVAGAMARQHAEDARGFLLSFARLLEAALPGEAQVQRRGWLGGAQRPVRRITVTLASGADAERVFRYALEDAGAGPLRATRTQVVRAVALKTESLPLDDWLAEVSAAITLRASRSKATRDALEQLLYGVAVPTEQVEQQE